MWGSQTKYIVWMLKIKGILCRLPWHKSHRSISMFEGILSSLKKLLVGKGVGVGVKIECIKNSEHRKEFRLY